MLQTENTALALVDLQVKLARAIHGIDAITESARKLVAGMRVLGVPILWAEQNPDGLGPTVPEVAEMMPGEPITKMSFSCCGEPRFVQALEGLGRGSVLLAGIEAHVCVYQTAMHLLDRGLQVQVVADAVGSRTPENREIALQKMRDAGVGITSVEMALFELLGDAGGPAFKEILKIVK